MRASSICKLSFVCTVFFMFVIQTNTKAQFFKKKIISFDKEQLQKAEDYFTEGTKEYALDNLPKSLAFFEKTLELNSQSAATYYMIAQIYNRQGNLYKAIQFAEKAVLLDENNKYYHLLLAQIFYKKQDFNEAAKVYLNLLKKIPNASEYYEDLAGIYKNLGKYEDALKCYDKIEKNLGVMEELTRAKQELLLKLNKLDEAINQGKKLIDAFPDEPKYTIILIEILINNNRIDEAEKLTLQLLEKDPQNPYAFLAMSDIYRIKKDDAKSFEYIQKAFKKIELDVDTKINILITKIRQLPNETIKQQCLVLGEILVIAHPAETKTLAIYGDILVVAGESKKALIYYTKAINIDNSHFKIWQQIALLDHELNLPDSLKVHTEKALELFPNQTIFWFYNGLAYMLNKNYKKAVISFEEGKKLASSDANMLMQFHTMLGDSYNGLKDYKKSDNAFEEALQIDPNSFIVLNNYSYYLSLRKDKLEYARKLSERVVKDNPDNATYLDTYAWILYVMKDYIKAKEIFEKIISNSGNGTIVEHYGDVLYQLGEKDKAWEIWKKAKQLGETSEFIDKKIADKKLYE